MVVYLDKVLVLNGVLDYLLLTVCGTVTASPIRRTRCLFGALLGALYAALILLPGGGRFGGIFWQLALAAAMTVIAYGWGRGSLRRFGVLLLLAAAFSGIVLVLTEVFSTKAAFLGSRVYYPVGLGTLVLTGGCAYGIMAWALSRLRFSGAEILPVTITVLGRTARLSALRDTGNSLRDPISGTRVLVADGTVLHGLLPEIPADRQALQSPETLLETVARTYPGVHPRLIPYKTVGVERGLLLALRPQEVTVQGERKAMLVAFSPVPVSDGGGYEALLGGEP